MGESLLGEGSFKAAKGLIRVRVESKSSQIANITISGDFFMYPEDSLWELEKKLRGTKTRREEVIQKISEFYRTGNVLTPGVSPEDFAEAIARALEASSEASN